jgi:hypothetical protein
LNETFLAGAEEASFAWHKVRRVQLLDNSGRGSGRGHVHMSVDT